MFACQSTLSSATGAGSGESAVDEGSVEHGAGAVLENVTAGAGGL